MSTDRWIFDAEYSHLDPYLSEATRHLGYITNAIYVKPTSPPRTIAVIIGNYDGTPGNKKDQGELSSFRSVSTGVMATIVSTCRSVLV